MDQHSNAAGRNGRHHRHVMLVAGAAVLVGAALLAPGALARSTGAPSCALVPTSLVKSVLGVGVGRLTSSSPLPGQTRCLYSVGSNPMGVQIVFTAGSRAAFMQKEKAYTNGGALVVRGVGTAAFTPSISVSAGSTSDLYVFGRANELDIAAIAPISKLELLAKRLAPRI